MVRFNFKGWSLKKFLLGKKHMLITIIGAVLGYLATSNPSLSVVIAAVGDIIYSIVDYYVQE